MKKNTNESKTRINIISFDHFGNISLFHWQSGYMVLIRSILQIQKPKSCYPFQILNHIGSVTFFYGLMIRIMQFFGVNSDFGIKDCQCNNGGFDNNSSLLCFIEKLEKRTAIIASLLLSFDPFGIANSIVFSGNIATLLFIGVTN